MRLKHTLLHTIEMVGMTTLAILIAVVALVFWLSQTTSGLKFILRGIEPSLEKQQIKIQYDGLTGTLFNPAAASLTVTSPQFSVTGEQIALRWKPFYLLAHCVDVQNFTAQELTISIRHFNTASHTKEASTLLEPSSFMHRPWHFHIKALNINHITSKTPIGRIDGHAHLSTYKQTWDIKLYGKQLNLMRLNAHLPKAIDFQITSLSDGLTQSTQIVCDSEPLSLKVISHGSQQDGQWINPTRVTDMRSPLGNWLMPTPADIIITKNQIILQTVCLNYKENKLCLSGHYDANGWTFNAVSKTLTLQDFNKLQQWMHLSGTTDLDLHISNENHHLNGHFTTDWHNVTLTSNDDYLNSQQSDHIDIKNLHWHTSLQSDQLKNQVQIIFNATNQLDWHCTLDKWLYTHPLAGDAVINSEFTANMDNLNVLHDFVPYLDSLKGQLHGQLKTTGTLQKIQNTGHLEITHSQATLPTLGIILKNIHLSATSTERHNLRLEGTMQSNGGTLNIDGAMTPSFVTPAMQLYLDSKDFTLIDLPEAKIHVSSTLKYQITPKFMRLTGQVNIPEASINGDVIKSNAQPFQDITYINRRGKVLTPSKKIPLITQVTAILGKNVLFTGFGIKTHVKGQLNISTTPSHPTIANGRLQFVNGSYQIYGKLFNINDTSYLIFDNDPIVSPYLDVTAIYQLNQIAANAASNTSFDKLVIGISIYGTIRDPKLTLFSQPSLSQEDILSYIILGQPLKDVQDQNNNTPLAQAALILAERGGSATLLQSIKSFLRIDELSVGTLKSTTPRSTSNDNTDTDIPTDDTAVFIGTSLGNRLHVGYGVGLFNQQRQITSSLQLTRYLKLSADTGDSHSGADLVFVINH